jgi:hypothetical protein
MPKTNTTTVTQDDDGYYRVRVPKALGDAMDLADEQVEWNIESGNKLSMSKTDD